MGGAFATDLATAARRAGIHNRGAARRAPLEGREPPLRRSRRSVRVPAKPILPGAHCAVGPGTQAPYAVGLTAWRTSARGPTRSAPSATTFATGSTAEERSETFRSPKDAASRLARVGADELAGLTVHARGGARLFGGYAGECANAGS